MPWLIGICAIVSFRSSSVVSGPMLAAPPSITLAGSFAGRSGELAPQVRVAGGTHAVVRSNLRIWTTAAVSTVSSSRPITTTAWAITFCGV